MLTPYIEADGITAARPLHPQPGLYDGFIARLLEVSRGGIEYARTGTLEIALDDDGVAKLLGTKVWLDTAGVESEWLDGNAVRVFEPSVTPAAHGGLLTMDHGLVGVESLISGAGAPGEAGWGDLRVSGRESVSIEQVGETV